MKIINVGNDELAGFDLDRVEKIDTNLFVYYYNHAKEAAETIECLDEENK